MRSGRQREMRESTKGSIMAKNELLPYWLLGTIICGHDGEGEGDGESGSEGEGEGSEDGEGEGEGEGGNTSTDGDPEDVDGLRKALAEERKRHKEERRLRRKAERDARTKEEAKQSKEENDKLKEAEDRASKSEARTKALADKLKSNSIRDAILAEARSQGFIDPTDALTDDIRNSIDVDQDDEDPADIDIDADSVKAAVKSLANRKKHLLKGSTDGQPSGGRFNGKGQGSGGTKGEQAKAAELTAMYPSLS